MRLGHLGGCTFGPDSCGMRRRRAVQKRASVSQLTQVMPKPRGRAPQGKAWDHFCGVWVPLSELRPYAHQPHTQATANPVLSQASSGNLCGDATIQHEGAANFDFHTASDRPLLARRGKISRKNAADVTTFARS